MNVPKEETVQQILDVEHMDFMEQKKRVEFWFMFFPFQQIPKLTLYKGPAPPEAVARAGTRFFENTSHFTWQAFEVAQEKPESFAWAVGKAFKSINDFTEVKMLMLWMLTGLHYLYNKEKA